MNIERTIKSMYKKVTKKITDVYLVDKYLTKETKENFILAINRLDEKIDLLKTLNERDLSL